VEPLVRDLGLHFLMSATFMLVAYGVVVALLLRKWKSRRVEADEGEAEGESA
jgi:hypothetical protein